MQIEQKKEDLPESSPYPIFLKGGGGDEQGYKFNRWAKNETKTKRIRQRWIESIIGGEWGR